MECILLCIHTVSAYNIFMQDQYCEWNIPQQLRGQIGRESNIYSIPFQDEGGAIQITKNVSYAPTLSIPLHNSTTLVESSKLTSRYEESH